VDGILSPTPDKAGAVLHRTPLSTFGTELSHPDCTALG